MYLDVNLSTRTPELPAQHGCRDDGGAQRSSSCVSVRDATGVLSDRHQYLRGHIGVAGLASFIIFLFRHLNLHHMNIWFAIRGYRMYLITPVEDGTRMSGRAVSY
jgi:hypothetical protein